MKKNGFAPIIILVIAILGVVGYIGSKYLLLKSLDITKSLQTPISLSTETPPSSETANIDDRAEFIDSEYKNKKYNFKLKYQSEYKFDGNTFSKGWIEEKGSQIVFKTKTLENNETREEIYTIYDANVTNKDRLSEWWRTNIKTDVDNGSVPNDYTVDTKVANLIWHPSKPLQPWNSAPPGFYVTLNDEAIKKRSEPVGMQGYSVYLYYNFDKPFIVNFITGNTGAGSTPGIFSYIERLN